MKGKLKLVLLAFLVLTMSCGANKLKDEGNAFMNALKKNDAEKSFEMLDISVQKEVGGLAGWGKWIKNRKPLKWEFTEFEVKEEGNGNLSGNADFATGQHLDVELNFSKLGEAWKLVGINFKSDK